MSDSRNIRNYPRRWYSLIKRHTEETPHAQYCIHDVNYIRYRTQRRRETNWDKILRQIAKFPHSHFLEDDNCIRSKPTETRVYTYMSKPISSFLGNVRRRIQLSIFRWNLSISLIDHFSYELGQPDQVPLLYISCWREVRELSATIREFNLIRCPRRKRSINYPPYRRR